MIRGVAVVTGASSGIGAATARRLAAEGYEVVAAARRRDRLDELAASTPGIRAATLDVTSAESVAELAASLGDVAVLVNNAGGALGVEPIERAEPADWQAMFDTNVLGVLRVTQALLPALEHGAGGHVVVTGSIAGHLVYEGGAGYAAPSVSNTVLTQGGQPGNGVITISYAVSSTTLSASPASSTSGQAVTFTAPVSAVASGKKLGSTMVQPMSVWPCFCRLSTR